jgi:hypothetical protein
MLALVFLALAVIAALTWLMPWGRPDQGPFPPPNIPSLTAAELAGLTETELLPRVEKECLRRMLVSNLDPRSAPSVLAPTARHLWNLMEGWGTIRSFGLQEQARLGRDPALAFACVLPRMIESYRALGLDAPTRPLVKALTLSQIPATLEAECLAAIAGSEPAVAAYAGAHRQEIFPDLGATAGRTPGR